MAISPHLKRRITETLDAAAAEELVSRLEHGDDLRADVSELRHQLQLGFATVDARFELVEQRFAAINTRFDALDQKFTEKIDLKVDGLRLEIREQVAGATAKLLKWSFVFWVSAVGAIAGLAGVLR